MKKLIHKDIYFKVTSTDDEKYIVRGVFSTQEVDRHGEVVDQKGWKLDEYLQNPVVLWAHDHYSPAIGQMIELGYDENGNLAGAVKFAVEEYDFAKTIFNLYKGRYVRAFSAGFRNDRYEVDEENGVIILKENTLYEMSAVNVPANAMALAYSKGLDLQPLENELQRIQSRVKQPVVIEEENLQNFTAQLAKRVAKEISNDTAVVTQKVETPNGKGGNNRKVHAVNKAIRALLKQKQSLQK